MHLCIRVMYGISWRRTIFSYSISWNRGGGLVFLRHYPASIGMGTSFKLTIFYVLYQESLIWCCKMTRLKDLYSSSLHFNRHLQELIVRKCSMKMNFKRRWREFVFPQKFFTHLWHGLNPHPAMQKCNTLSTKLVSEIKGLWKYLFVNTRS